MNLFIFSEKLPYYILDVILIGRIFHALFIIHCNLYTLFVLSNLFVQTVKRKGKYLLEKVTFLKHNIYQIPIKLK